MILSLCVFLFFVQEIKEAKQRVNMFSLGYDIPLLSKASQLELNAQEKVNYKARVKELMIGSEDQEEGSWTKPDLMMGPTSSIAAAAASISETGSVGQCHTPTRDKVKSHTPFQSPIAGDAQQQKKDAEAAAAAGQYS